MEIKLPIKVHSNKTNYGPNLDELFDIAEEAGQRGIGVIRVDHGGKYSAGACWLLFASGLERASFGGQQKAMRIIFQTLKVS